jgi:hypothetical protein
MEQSETATAHSPPDSSCSVARTQEISPFGPAVTPADVGGADWSHDTSANAALQLMAATTFPDLDETLMQSSGMEIAE